MAAREKKGGGEFVLESRHLVGLFMLLVVIFAVVFTLGYLMGRSQYDSGLRAAIGSTLQDDSLAAAPSAKSKAKSQHPDTSASSAANSPKTGTSTTATPPKAGAGPAPVPPKNGGGLAKVGGGATASPSSKEDSTSAPKNPDWDFYHSAEPKTTEDHLQPPKKTVAAAQPPAQSPAPKAPSAAKQSAPPKESAPAGTPLVANGAIMLQVAAVQREGDAMALAQALQEKKFPAYVITPGPDKYYRVQVGPYSDNQSASNARHDLEANGFKSIIKR